MMFLAVVFCFALISLVGAALVRRLGWPTTTNALGRWCLALFAVGLLASSAPELLRRIAPFSLALPTVGFMDLVAGLAVLGLGVLGYVSWSRGEAMQASRPEGDDRVRFQPRRRALPPPPARRESADDDHSFAPITVSRIDADERRGE